MINPYKINTLFRILCVISIITGIEFYELLKDPKLIIKDIFRPKNQSINHSKYHQEQEEEESEFK